MSFFSGVLFYVFLVVFEIFLGIQAVSLFVFFHFLFSNSAKNRIITT